jgi:hypothetical protein
MAFTAAFSQKKAGPKLFRKEPSSPGWCKVEIFFIQILKVIVYKSNASCYTVYILGVSLSLYSF